MELLAPAGTLEKARVAFRYGADAVYMGIPGYSLRAAAEPAPDAIALRELKAEFPGRRVYGAFNRFFHQKDMDKLPEALDTLAALPLDALILADIGVVEQVRAALPEVELHLSTQANCTNGAAARVYQRLGFSRIVPARELGLEELREIRREAPEIELEVFVHGAMCMAYSGRCMLSSAMAGRSANEGDCAHSCRWHYALVEEKRPGEYYPVEQEQDHLAILSARDLMLLDHLDKLKSAGVRSIKIEGRNKSALYTAITTRAYRAALDRDRTLPQWREELFRLPHRPYTTGFLLGDQTVHEPALESSGAGFRLMGIIGETKAAPPDRTPIYSISVKNTLYRDTAVDILFPDGTILDIPGLDLCDESGSPVQRVVQGKPAFLHVPDSWNAGELRDGIIRARRETPDSKHR